VADDVRFTSATEGRIELNHLGLPNVVPPGPREDNTLLDLLSYHVGARVRVTVEFLFEEDSVQ
jgi:hypothetical protein